MMNIDKLIDRLYTKQQSYNSYMDSEFVHVMEDAITAFSTLQAENENLRILVELGNTRTKDYRVMRDRTVKAEAENEKLRAELEQVKRERDEAVQCIKGIAKSGRVWMCPYCVHAKDTTGGIAECELDVGVCMMPYSKFEWNRQKED